MKQRAAVGDTGDSEQISQSKKNEKLQDALMREDMKWLLGSPSGRRIMLSILDKCFVEYATIDPNLAIRILAKQEIGFAIKREIELAYPEAWLLLERERLEIQGVVVQKKAREEQEGDE